MNRREIVETLGAAAVVSSFALQDAAGEWGAPVFDLHFHLRPPPSSNLAHLDGAGVTKANLLARGRPRAGEALLAIAPGLVTWFNRYDVSPARAARSVCMVEGRSSSVVPNS
jgi:hypothetical protein